MKLQPRWMNCHCVIFHLLTMAQNVPSPVRTLACFFVFCPLIVKVSNEAVQCTLLLLLNVCFHVKLNQARWGHSSVREGLKELFPDILWCDVVAVFGGCAFVLSLAASQTNNNDILLHVFLSWKCLSVCLVTHGTKSGETKLNGKNVFLI